MSSVVCEGIRSRLATRTSVCENPHTVNSPLTKIAAFSAAAFGLCGPLTAEPTAVTIRVEQANKSDMNPKDRIARTHCRKLHVFVTNNSQEQLPLKIKYMLFGRDMLTHDIVKVSEGEQPVEVKPHSAANVDSAEAKIVSSAQHWDAKAKKMIDPSGATIVGAGVQVLQGDKLLAEWYDPMSVKDEWGKAPPMIGLKPSAPPAKPAATPVKPKGMLARD